MWHDAFSPATWSNWVLAIAAIGAIGVGLWTLQAIRRQAAIMEQQIIQAAEAGKQTDQIIATTRDTAQRQLRAYVLVSSALLKFKEPGIPEAQVHFRNFGQTPAYDFHGWVGMYIGDFPLAASLPPAPGNLQMGHEPLPPGRVSIHVISRFPPVQPQLVPLLGTIEGTIYVYGEMSYRDAFGNARSLRYRLLYGGREGVQPVKNTEGLITGYLLKADLEGNEAD
jgi:hypothetical protein